MPRRKKPARAQYQLNVAFGDKASLTGNLNRLRDKVDRIASLSIESSEEDVDAFLDFTTALDDFDPIEAADEELLSGEASSQLAEFEQGFNL
tara:strand:- start:602 stop:877 length:276 start_codon:yes stop_codon:yes gene_type:complete